MVKKIKVLIIGKDNHTRVKWVEPTAELCDNMYQIDQEAIYYSKGGLLSGIDATIMFRENNAKAISGKAKNTVPLPQDSGDAIARAAWALAYLMRNKEESLIKIIAIIAAFACIIGAIGAYYGYDNAKKLDALKTSMVAPADGSVTPPITLPTISPSNAPTIAPVVTPTRTPMPTISTT
jgi:hypothetical protein